ncbi:MAG TPA: HAD-IA family hydrolase [Gemmatimonadales bacterium]|nr:HAD-IA family hydrolase [Gemmatimonadales bacterium]
MKCFECRAILFDLDGVLVDSTAYVEEQWRRWARSKGLPEEPFLRVCHGRRALETIRLAAPHLDAEAEVAAFVPEEYEGDGRFQALEGAGRLLEALPRGTWAVATSGTRTMAIERLRGSGLAVPRVLVCAEDVAHGKPSPDVYLLAAAELGVAPADCLVVEDAPAGVEAAHAAGMRVVAVTTTHLRHQLPADVCTTSLTNIHLGRILSAPGSAPRMELLVQDR